MLDLMNKMSSGGPARQELFGIAIHHKAVDTPLLKHSQL